MLNVLSFIKLLIADDSFVGVFFVCVLILRVLHVPKINSDILVTHQVQKSENK